MIFATIDWHSFFFMLFALLACGFGLGVVLSSNIVRMAFYLVLSLGSTAGLFFLAGAEFVGAMQLMIYVGGTLVLLVFGVMLTAQKSFISMKLSGGEWIIALPVGGVLLMLLAGVAMNVESWNQPRMDRDQISVAATNTTTQIGTAFIGERTDRLDQSDPVLRGGMSGYLLPFEIVSVHLLVVLIGAAYLARTKRRVSSTPTE